MTCARSQIPSESRRVRREAPTGDARRAIAIARKCVAKKYPGCCGGWGGVWMFEAAESVKSVDGELLDNGAWTLVGNWYFVRIPEAEFDSAGKPIQLGSPSGIEWQVNVDTGACKQLPQE